LLTSTSSLPNSRSTTSVARALQSAVAGHAYSGQEHSGARSVDPSLTNVKQSCKYARV
jgi:hypothetical protein